MTSISLAFQEGERERMREGGGRGRREKKIKNKAGRETARRESGKLINRSRIVSWGERWGGAAVSLLLQEARMNLKGERGTDGRGRSRGGREGAPGEAEGAGEGQAGGGCAPRHTRPPSLNTGPAPLHLPLQALWPLSPGQRRPQPKTKFLPTSCQHSGSWLVALLSPRGHGHGQFGMCWCLCYVASCWVPDRRPSLACLPDLAREGAPSVLGKNARHQLHSQPLLPLVPRPARPPPPLKRAGAGHPAVREAPRTMPSIGPQKARA